MDRDKEIWQMASEDLSLLEIPILDYYNDYDKESLDSRGLVLLQGVRESIYELCKHIAENRL